MLIISRAHVHADNGEIWHVGADQELVSLAKVYKNYPSDMPLWGKGLGRV